MSSFGGEVCEINELLMGMKKKRGEILRANNTDKSAQREREE